MCPKSTLRKRSVTRSASLCGRPRRVSSQPPSLKPVVSTTKTSPSQRPTEYPNQVGSVTSGSERPSVKHLPEGHAGERLIEKRGDLTGVQNLERPAAEIDPRCSWRQAIPVWVIDVVSRFALSLYSLRPWRHLHVSGSEILGQVEEQAPSKAGVSTANRALCSPDARQVGPSIRCSRSGRRKIRFAVWQTRNSRRWMVQPLRIGHVRVHEGADGDGDDSGEEHWRFHDA